MNNNLPNAPEERLASVKAMTQGAENKIVKLLPESDVDDVRQLKEGTILRCGNDYQWTGNVRVELSADVDAGAVRDDIAIDAADQGFTVTADETITGEKRFELIDAQGVQLLLTRWVEGNAIDIDSGSPCFSLPRDFDVPGEY
jgi:hypothetical protein